MDRTAFLTARQRELLDFIRSYQAEHRITPSFEDMRGGLGVKSKANVHRLLAALEERGCITRMPNRARAIEVAPDPHLMILPEVVQIQLRGRIS